MAGPRHHLSELNHASSYSELMFRVALWFAAQRGAVTRGEIESRWGVNRATACRWRNAFQAASGRDIRPANIPSPAATGTTSIQGIKQ